MLEFQALYERVELISLLSEQQTQEKLEPTLSNKNMETLRNKLAAFLFNLPLAHQLAVVLVSIVFCAE